MRQRPQRNAYTFLGVTMHSLVDREGFLLQRGLTPDHHQTCRLGTVAASDGEHALTLISLASIRPCLRVHRFLALDKQSPDILRSKGETTTNDPQMQNLLKKRACKVVLKEVLMLFSLRPCVYFHCLGNGWLTLEELDSQPMMLCPVCLRKVGIN